MADILDPASLLPCQPSRGLIMLDGHGRILQPRRGLSPARPLPQPVVAPSALPRP